MKTILLLEDAPDLTKLFRQILMPKGYVVLEVRTADAARTVGCIAHVDLLIADVTVPCCGVHVAFQLKTLTPDLRILFTSGYPLDLWEKLHRTELCEIPSDSFRVLRKPFYPSDLLRTVDQLIGAATDIRPVAVSVGR